MTDWTADELARIGRASELRIATARRDGSALDRAEVDAAYRAKFGSGFYTDRMVSDAAAETTLIVDPA